jgi:hypothetical protein
MKQRGFYFILSVLLQGVEWVKKQINKALAFSNRRIIAFSI